MNAEPMYNEPGYSDLQGTPEGNVSLPCEKPDARGRCLPLFEHLLPDLADVLYYTVTIQVPNWHLILPL